MRYQVERGLYTGPQFEKPGSIEIELQSTLDLQSVAQCG
jgi:hypothetical protein